MITQEIGETADAYLEDLERLIDKTIHLNKDRNDIYYIWIAQKPQKLTDARGRLMIKQHYKVYTKRPPSIIGTIIVTVDNSKGYLDWEVNPPDVPFAHEALGGELKEEILMDTPIANAYKHN